MNMNMKKLRLIIAVCFLAFGATVSQADQTDVLTRISNETGVPVSTLQTQQTATGLGFGELETANLLATASGKSFDDIVAMHKAGEGWGKIARDNGLNLGKIVSAAHRSAQAGLNAQNADTETTHGLASFFQGVGKGFGKGVGSFKGVGKGFGKGFGKGVGKGFGKGVGSFKGIGRGHFGH